MATHPSNDMNSGAGLLKTPNLGTGMLEDRERIRFAELRGLRRDRVFAAMEADALDACIFGREANARYASGVRRLWTAGSRPFVPTCAIVRDTKEIRLLSFSASYEGIPEELQPDNIYPVTWNPANFVDQVLATPGFRDARRIGVDGITPLFRQLLADAMPDAQLIAAEPMMRALRRQKLPEEIACIRTAVAIAESAIYEAARLVAPGVSEKQLQAAYLARMCTLGTSQFAQQGTFTMIDAHGGLRWITGSRLLDEGSFVALAGGALWAGYEGSLARTWWSGARKAPGVEDRALYQSWRNAIEPLIAKCRSGASGSDLRSTFEANVAGAGAFTVYSIGLGHEGPIAGTALDPAVEHRQRVTDDMVLGVRVFVPAEAGGYLGEEMILVTDRGTEMLTSLGHGPLAAAS